MIDGQAIDGQAIDAQAGPRSLADRWAPVMNRARPWDPPAVATLVVVPHPDDEALSTGGLTVRQRRRDVSVQVLAVTDGEAAYPDVDALSDMRADEQRWALDTLGVGHQDIRRLGLPDGAVARHEDALVKAIIQQLPGIGLLVAPWTGDHHTDHEACGRAAQRAAHHTGTPLMFGLFWTWHHAGPAQVAARNPVKVVLTDSERQTRHQALLHHRSQITTAVVEQPVLSPADLEPFTWTAEYYIAAGTPA